MKNVVIEKLDLNIDSELFSPLSSEEKKSEEIVRPSVGYWANAWRRLKSNKVALFSLIMIIVIIAFAIFGPIIVEKIFGYTYQSTDKTASNLWPNAQHWFGTDNLGRDLFVRVMYGARYSLIIAFAASILNLVIGVLYGGVAGFLGGKVDNIMMRIVDILYSIPTLIYVVLLMNVLKTEGSSGMFAIIVAMAISSWVGMARIVRGDILQLKQQEFVLAAKTLGASKSRILLRHLIPNCLGSIIVTMTLFVPSAIFTEAFLSYIGLGLNAPLASLGTLANDAKGLLTTQPYQLLFPAAMICLIILAFNLFGDGLTEALDPKHQK
ncbi:ABC transporter permease [Clostridioides difficile]